MVGMGSRESQSNSNGLEARGTSQLATDDAGDALGSDVIVGDPRPASSRSAALRTAAVKSCPVEIDAIGPANAENWCPDRV